MKKILGLDLGTNSIGWAIVSRNEDASYKLEDKGVHIFQDGVAHGKQGEYPAVQERTNARASRRHYFRRRLRKIELLKVLVDNKLCPDISKEALSEWKLHKVYPLTKEFIEWQHTDEASDKNPYHDRYRCLTEKLDLSQESDRYTLGRALYHIIQRRGFLSNRKDSTADRDGVVKDSIKSLTEEMQKSNCTYLGEYFYKLYKEGTKIRTAYTARVEHYEREFDAICDKQGLDNELKVKLHRAIFYQRPLKSQKGLVGHCVFEKDKARCPVSHPKYEAFRVISFINNIRVKTDNETAYRPLNDDEIAKITPLFYRKSKARFEFEEIAKKIAGKGYYGYKTDKGEYPYRFNFKMYTSVTGAPVTASLMSLFGEHWEENICSVYTLAGDKTKDEIINDVWHAMFSFDNDELLAQWAMRRLQLSEKEAEEFAKIHIPQGYASLSLNAINKILPYLYKGYRYDQAVMLANLPAATGYSVNDEAFKRVERDVESLLLDHDDNPLERERSLYSSVSDYLIEYCGADQKQIDKLYHPSMTEVYPSVCHDNAKGTPKLGSPRTPSIKNPMAMRALFRLRKLLNELLTSGKIDKETEIHIEFARGLNDSNMRKAIETYQNERQKLRNEYVTKIKEFFNNGYEPTDDDILKYSLWEEQNHTCPYTGKEIALIDFLGANPRYDIEHTVPRAREGDNSQMNKTLCDSRFNREQKKSKLPSELSNYNDIMAVIETFGWRKKIDELKKNIEKTKSYSATKAEKDAKIQRRHTLKMHLDYWEGKLKRFTLTEVPEGFSNRQGVDVGIIGRYARLYLKSVFWNVYTVKGATTAEFRKMWGLQEEYTKKERVNHSHHCVDAITIACIGRNEYDKWAVFNRMEGTGSSKPIFAKPWATFTEDLKKISEEILVPHYTASNLSKHTKKRLRKRGVLQYTKKGENKKVIYTQGDTARGVLHEQSFYGAIKQNDEIRYVIRKSLDSLKEEDVDKIVDETVKAKIKDVIAVKGFKSAMSDTIWMNEDLKIPIKKVRIYVKNEPFRLKEHRDKSKLDYKSHLYVQNDSNYCMAIYEGTNSKGKQQRSFKILSNMDAVKYYNGKTSDGSLFPMEDGNGLKLKYTLKTGTMVLFYENTPEEVYGCSMAELSKRLYKLTGLSSMVINQKQNKYLYGTLECRHHLEARKSSDLKVKSGGWKNGEEYRPVIKNLHTQFNALVEGVDFNIMLDGQIKFK